MSDTQQKRPDPHSTEPHEDEEIIDLLDEVSEGSLQHPISSLEQRLLDLENLSRDQDRIAADLPDIDDLITLGFEETDAAKDPSEALPPAGPGPAATPIAEEGALRPAAQENAIKQIPEFDPQTSEAEDFLDVENFLAGPGFEEKQSEPEEDEVLELIEVEEDESDDAIVWFDDLNKDLSLPETMTEAGPPETEVLDAATLTDPETSGADVFSADVGSAPADAPIAPDIGPAETDAGAAAAAVAAAIHPPLPSAASVSPPAEPVAPPALSDAEIEAAIERVIERKLGRTIESVIHQALENAVSKEIERLKRLLLENDPGAAP